MPEEERRRPGRPRLTDEQRAERLLAREAARAQIQDVMESPSPPPPIIDEPPVIDGSYLAPLAIHKLKVHIYPHFGEEDKGDGGIRRVVEAQVKHIPQFGIEIVDTAEEADVIAYHATVPPPYINNFPKKAFVAMCHGLYWSEYEWGNWALKANADVLEGIRVADHVIACSEWVANSIRRHTSRPVTVIYHGVDVEEWIMPEGITQKDYILWNKTRPDPVCDPEPMNQLALAMPDNAFISTFGREGPNIAITGKLPFEQARKLIMQAGVYLCTSRETFGIGTLEAMACGVPVVGFNFAGQAEFIEHGVDGWLAQPGDINGLAEGVRWALGRDRSDISAAAIRKAKAFDWPSVAERYAQVFMDTADEAERPRPTTSIIVTNYNLHQYLGDCLESVRAQTDPDFECIIVDDASTSPKGREIAMEFAGADPRFHLVANTDNVYLAEARNVGIRVARGRYILPLDADDMLDPDAVALLASALDSDRSIAVAYGNVQFREEDGRTLTNYGQQFQLGHSSWPYQFSHEQQIMQRNLLPYSSMFRRTAWLWTGGYRRRCKTAEDADFWTRLSSYGFRPKMVTDHDTLIYRNREGSMSRSQGEVNWVRWFPWSKKEDITPAGAVTRVQLPVPSLDPIQISVIIPVGPGHDKLVTDAIDSVDSQFFRNWECIVINDTGAPLDTELPAWVTVIETKGHTGAAHARNVGIEASKGKWFLPLDADDYLEPDALQFMFNAAFGTNEVIYTDFWQGDAEGKNVNIHHTDDYDPELITGAKRLVNGKMREGMMHSVTALTPKRFWKQVGGYDELLPAWEDWDFQIALGAIGVCSRRIATPLFFYRKHTGYRREENMEFFERSKEGILRKWGNLWEGGTKLMACGSCRRGQSINAGNTNFGNARALATPQNSDAVLIRYKGEQQGSTAFRGASRTTYWFARGDEKYVLAQDVELFLRRGDFEAAPPAQEEVEISNSPLLEAVGQA